MASGTNYIKHSGKNISTLTLSEYRGGRKYYNLLYEAIFTWVPNQDKDITRIENYR